MLSLRPIGKNRPFAVMAMVLALSGAGVLAASFFFDGAVREAELGLHNDSNLLAGLDDLLSDGWQLECSLLSPGGNFGPAKKVHYQGVLGKLNRDATTFTALMKQTGGETKAATFESLLIKTRLGAEVINIENARFQLAQLRTGLGQLAADLKHSMSYQRQLVSDSRRRARRLVQSGLLATGLSLVLGLVWYRGRDPEAKEGIRTANDTGSAAEWQRRYAEQQSLYKIALDRCHIVAWRVYAQDGYAEFEFGSEQQREFYGLRTRMKFEEFRALIHPDDAAPVSLAAEEMIGNQRPDYDAFYRMRVSSGEWRYMHSTGRTAVRSSDGSSIAASGLLQDVTDLQNNDDFVNCRTATYAGRLGRGSLDSPAVF